MRSLTEFRRVESRVECGYMHLETEIPLVGEVDPQSVRQREFQRRDSQTVTHCRLGRSWQKRGFHLFGSPGEFHPFPLRG